MIVATAPAPRLATPVAPTPTLALRPGRRFELVSLHTGHYGTEALLFVRDDSLVTSRFPGFEKKLLTHVPRLLENVQCFNGSNQAFAVEMLATELGHLYEHVWLEVLCCDKLAVATTAHYAGETSWNWREEPRGLFHIHLNATSEDRMLVQGAAMRTSAILEHVLG